MKTIKQYLKSTIIAFIALALIAMIALAPKVQAIPYSGDTTPPAPSPAFNVYTGVPSEGNESDFFRGKVEGATTPSVNDLSTTCETGKRLQLRVYVHNGASQYQNNNGTGPSVAKDTKVKVALPGSQASNFTPSATISSSNAGSVSDTMTITCSDGRVVTLNYIAGSAKQYTQTGSKPLSDSIVTTGAPVGTMNPDGNVWGCWEQRVYVTLVVEIKESEKPKTPKYECKATDVKVDDSSARKVTATVNGVAINGATIVGYEINWGDGSKSSAQTDTHTYSKDGTYTIKGRVLVKLPNGEEKWVDSTNCTKTVTFENGKPVTPVTPVTPEVPTTLPDTGAGEIFGLFSATSAAGAAAHHVYNRRKRGL